MAYTREQIGEKIENSLKTIDTFYKEDIVNYSGKTTDTAEYYSEIISAELLNNLALFKGIKEISRGSNGKSYNTLGHHDGTIETRVTNRNEENYVKSIYSKSFIIDSLTHKVIDFQTPLKDKQSDKAGKIDLIVADEKNDNLYLIELKFGTNTETLLRAILEIYTYYKIVDEGKLKSDFISLLPDTTNVDNIEVKPAVMLVSSQCKSYKEFDDIKNRPKLFKLAKEMNITFFKSAIGETFEMISAANLCN